MVKMVKKLKKYKNLRISILKSEPVPPFSHTNFASHNRRTSSLELALCMSFSKFFTSIFLSIYWITIQGLVLSELFPRGYDRIDLLPFVQLRLLQNCAEEIGRYMIFVQLNYHFLSQDHRQSTHTNRAGFYQSVLSLHLRFPSLTIYLNP